MQAASIKMNNIFTDTLNGKKCSRPPVWLMRQAGRILPRYMKMREKYSFEQLFTTPELAAEVTLLPVEDLGVDAAILFSDILTVPKAMGLDMDWTQKGPVFNSPLVFESDPIKKLDVKTESLSYVYQAARKVKQMSNIPLIGFCGGPLTVLCYMLEGVSSNQTFPLSKTFFYQQTSKAKQLIDLLTEVSIEYAVKQAECGIDAFQLFESNAGIVPLEMYEKLFLPAVTKIGKAVRAKGIPFIFFGKGISGGVNIVKPETCDFYSADWQMPLSVVRKNLDKEIGLQGNFDPWLLFAPKDVIEKAVINMKPFFKENPKWIANLGHGVLANTPLENVKFLISRIKETIWE